MTILSLVFIIHFLPPLAPIAFHLPAKAGTLSAGFCNSTAFLVWFRLIVS
jgi:hypothetical protein